MFLTDLQSQKLNHIRGLAAMMVVIGHTTLNMLKLLPQAHKTMQNFALGSKAMPIFFILSGFLFAYISNNFRYTFSYKGFMKNRMLRIFPLVGFVTIWVIAFSITQDSITGTQLLDLFTLQNGSLLIARYNSPLWAVPVEFLFYLIVPVVVMWVNRKGLSYFFLYFLFVFFLRTVLLARNIDTYQSFVFRMPQFFIGMALSLLLEWHNHNKKVFFNKKTVVILFFVFIAIVFYFFGLPAYNRSHSLKLLLIKQDFEAIFATSFILLYLILPFSLGKHVNGFLSFLGKISFSAYVWHFFLLHFTCVSFNKIFPILKTEAPLFSVLIMEVGYVLCVISFSWLSYILIEQPFLHKKGHYVIKEVSFTEKEGCEA